MPGVTVLAGFMQILLPVVFSLLAGFAASPATAGEKTDVVTLFNGDRVTCEVEGLIYGQLACDTDHMGTVYIELDEIATLTTTQLLQVELSDGRRIFGTAPDPAATPGSIRIKGGSWSGSASAEELPFTEIVRIATVDVGDAWYDRLDGAFSIGYTYTQANDLSVLNMSGDIGSRDQTHKWGVSFDAQATTQEDNPSSQRAVLAATLERFLPDRYYSEGLLQFSRNQELGLDLRSLIGATLGRYLAQGRSSEWRAGAGLAASTERGIDGDNRESIDALFDTTFRIFQLDRPKTALTASLNVLPSLTDTGRMRGELSIELRKELIADLFLEISVYDSYDNEPAGDSPHNDWGLTTSLGYSF